MSMRAQLVAGGASIKQVVANSYASNGAPMARQWARHYILGIASAVSEIEGWETAAGLMFECCDAMAANVPAVELGPDLLPMTPETRYGRWHKIARRVGHYVGFALMFVGALHILSRLIHW